MLRENSFTIIRSETRPGLTMINSHNQTGDAAVADSMARDTKCCRRAEGLLVMPSFHSVQRAALTYLDLSGNQLSGLPSDLVLPQLRTLFLSENKFTDFPRLAINCPTVDIVAFRNNGMISVSEGCLPITLRWLILTGNQIARLPDDIGRCTRLQKLMLSGNQLVELPHSLAACRRLELVRLAGNKLAKFPDVLAELPRLAWLGIADNPFLCDQESAAAAAYFSTDSFPTVPRDAIELGASLGKGASGEIFQAQIIGQSREQQYAVKIFNSDGFSVITSDGWPSAELRAGFRAGPHHRSLVLPCFRIEQEQANPAIVMPLFPKDLYRTVGLPPTLETCTRDVLPGSEDHCIILDADTQLTIARDIASAAAHLHQRRVMHGDLYLHNVLYSESMRHAVLGDLGAATCYPEAQPGSTDPKEQPGTDRRTELSTDREAGVNLARILQSIDVCAFGYMLQDLGSTATGMPDILRRIGDLCLQEEVEKRPTFSEIIDILSLKTRL